MISGFCHKVAENCALLGYYAASSGNFLMMFRDNLSVEDRTDRFSKNAGKKLPVLAV
jgi:hypothetical protein